MNEVFLIKVIRKLRIPYLRKYLLNYIFSKHGIKLQNFFSFFKDHFFIYQVNDHFIPNESLFAPISYEIQFAKLLNESLYDYQPKTGDTVIDIGAGLGEEVLFFSKMTGETGKVIAIEANPNVFEVLQKTVAFNKLDNVLSFNSAIFTRNGTINLVKNKGSYESAFINPEKKNSSIEVTSIRFDSFILEQKLETIDLLKVNIEGAERYLTETLLPEQINRIKHIAIACHDFRYNKEGNEFFKTKELISNFFQSHGFTIHSRQTDKDYLNDWVYGSKSNN